MNLNETYLQKQTGNGIGWYGKIPGNGDFIQRGLPSPLVNKWAHWFHSGLAAKQLAAPRNKGDSLFGGPGWSFILPATLGTPFVQLGHLLPSRDRVGRHYPLFAMWLVSLEQWQNEHLVLTVERYYRIGKILQLGVHQCHCVEHIDRALQALPPIPSSPVDACNAALMQDGTLAELNFDPQQYGSFCWNNSDSGKPFDTYIHSGHLTVQLFHYLFDPAGSAGYAPYGKMFD